MLAGADRAADPNEHVVDFFSFAVMYDKAQRVESGITRPNMKCQLLASSRVPFFAIFQLAKEFILPVLLIFRSIRQALKLYKDLLPQDWSCPGIWHRLKQTSRCGPGVGRVKWSFDWRSASNDRKICSDWWPLGGYPAWICQPHLSPASHHLTSTPL